MYLYGIPIRTCSPDCCLICLKAPLTVGAGQDPHHPSLAFCTWHEAKLRKLLKELRDDETVRPLGS